MSEVYQRIWRLATATLQVLEVGLAFRFEKKLEER